MVKTPLIAQRAGHYSVEAVGAEFDPDFLLLDTIWATALLAWHGIRIPGAHLDLEIGL